MTSLVAVLLVCQCLANNANAGWVYMRCGPDKWEPKIVNKTAENLVLNNEYFKDYQDCWEVIIKDVHISSIADGTFASMSNLWILRLLNTGLTELKSTLWTGLENSLAYLYLTDNNFPTLEANSFSGLRKVWLLDLDNCGIKTIKSGAFSGLPDLKALTLKGNPVNSMDENMLGSGPLQEYFKIWFDCESLPCSHNLCWVLDKMKSGEIDSNLDYCETKCSNHGKTVMQYHKDEC